MNRRRFLAATGLTGLTGLGGCTGLLERAGFGVDRVPTAPAVLNDRPDAVYYPTHVEGMAMVGTGRAGDVAVGLTYSYPHRFWTVTGTRAERVEIGADHTVHLMATIWDPETGQVLPIASGLGVEVRRGGETVAERTPWPMLSQNMGFHYGDNVSLEGDGAYTVRIRVGSMGIRRLGGFEGRFKAGGTAEIAFEYAREARNEIEFRRLDDRVGQHGAVDLAEMKMLPASRLPPPGDLPGRVAGEGESGDAVLAATIVTEPPLGGPDAPYLAVSPRTPYNRIPLPMMALSATLNRGGDTRFDGHLSPAIDPELGYHYGAIVEPPGAGDRLEVCVDAPPQVARHEGFETAFLDMPPVRFRLA